MPYTYKYNPFTDNLDKVFDDGGNSFSQNFKDTFDKNNLDIDGNLAIDITALGVITIQDVAIINNENKREYIGYQIVGNTITVFLLSPDIAGTWTYIINYNQ